MKKSWLIGVVGAFIVGILIILGKSLIWSPKLNISEDLWFFGKVKNLRSIKHHFIITNQGNADLSLAVWPSCHRCINSSFTSARIPPNGKRKLTLELNILKEGMNEASVMLETNDSKQRFKKVTLKAIAIK